MKTNRTPNRHEIRSRTRVSTSNVDTHAPQDWPDNFSANAIYSISMRGYFLKVFVKTATCPETYLWKNASEISNTPQFWLLSTGRLPAGTDRQQDSGPEQLLQPDPVRLRQGRGNQATHDSNGDALVTTLEGTARVTINGTDFTLNTGESIIMPAKIPHSVFGAGTLQDAAACSIPRQGISCNAQALPVGVLLRPPHHLPRTPFPRFTLSCPKKARRAFPDHPTRFSHVEHFA